MTQMSTRTDDPTLSRNYSTNDRMLRYKRIKDFFFMDTFFATKKGGQSSRGHTCCQLFVTDRGFIYVVPMKKKSEVLHAIKQFTKEIGAFDSFVADMSGEQMSSEVEKFCNDIGTTLRAQEEGTPWSNKAELYIGLIKEEVRKDMSKSICPLCFWDYFVERRARINNLTAKNAFRLHGSTHHTLSTGDEGDISNLCQYGWYEWFYFRDQTAEFPNNKEALGRLPDEMGMRWPNGYSKQMAELSLEDPSDPSKLINFIALLKSRKQNYLMNSLRGDGEHQCLHQSLSSQKLSKNLKIMNNKNSQHLRLKTLLTLLASSSTSNQHMTKLSMLKSSYKLEKKWPLAK